MLEFIKAILDAPFPVNMLPFFLLFVLLVSIWGVYSFSAKRKQLKTSQTIPIGMSEAKMLSLMGGGYTRSLLKNGRTKYEWRINASSYSSHGTTSYSGVQKATIYCKDGFVEEVRGFNIY